MTEKRIKFEAHMSAIENHINLNCDQDIDAHAIMYHLEVIRDMTEELIAAEESERPAPQPDKIFSETTIV